MTATQIRTYILRDHITLLTDMINDWTSSPTKGREFFVPAEYEYHLKDNYAGEHIQHIKKSEYMKRQKVKDKIGGGEEAEARS